MFLDLTTGFFGRWMERELSDSRTYEATNGNKSRDEWQTDCIFASDNDMIFGYGVLINEDGTPMKGAGTLGIITPPEEILANAVVNYWTTAKTKLYMELRYDSVGDITPQDIVRVADVSGYAISIGNEWRDDIIRVTTLQW
jgi:hypothetical protein